MAVIMLFAIISSVQSSFVANFEDDRILVEWSHNVFVGKVIKQVGTVDRHGSPTTQFEVDVVLNIKGNLAGKTVVSQEGGFRNGRLILLHGGDVLGPAREGSDPLVEPGSTYLFTSRFSTNENWQFLMTHPNGRKVISKDATLDRAQLEALARQDEKVLKLQEAHKKNEVFYAQEKSPVTEALDRWLASYHLPHSDGDPEPDTRELDPILEEFSSQVGLVIATRVEQGDPRLSEPRVHLGAIVALRRLGIRAVPAVPVLVRALQQIRRSAPVEWWRFNDAMAILGEAGTSSTALEEIFALIPGPESFSAFRGSISTLVSIARRGGTDVPKRVDPFLAHENLHVRLAAAVTISRCVPPTERSTAVIRECLEQFQPDATLYVLQELKEMNGDKMVFIPQLVALVKNPNRIIASSSAMTIGQIGKGAVPTIKNFLSDEDPEIRRHGWSALYRYVTVAKEEPNTWPLVVSAIPSIAQESPRQALWILSQFQEEIGHSGEIAAVLRKLAESPETGIRNEAMRLLRRIPPTSLR